MILRTHRFHGYNSLRHVYSRGTTVRGSNLALKYVLNRRRSSYRAAVVVSRKVHKSAVVRNRIRRRIYEILRGYQSDISQPYDIVITVFHEQLAAMPAKDLQDAVEELMHKAGILSVPQQPGQHAIVEPKE